MVKKTVSDEQLNYVINKMINEYTIVPMTNEEIDIICDNEEITDDE